MSIRPISGPSIYSNIYLHTLVNLPNLINYLFKIWGVTRDGEILPEDKLPQGFNILSISDGRSYEVGLLLWMINNYASLDLCFHSCFIVFAKKCFQLFHKSK